MRWSYLVPRVVLVALVWAFLTLAFDPLLRWGMRKTATSINGATVDVAEVQTRFFPPRIEVINVGVTDPDHPHTNRVQFGTLALDLDAAALLQKRLVINEAQLLGLEFDTRRRTPGQLVVHEDDAEDDGPSWVGIAWDGLQTKLKDAGKRWLADALAQAKGDFDPDKLQTVQLAKSLEDKWKAKIDFYEQRLDAIEARIRALEDGVKTKGTPLERLQAWQAVAREVQALIAEAGLIRNELAGLYNEAGGDVASMSVARSSDLQSIKQKVQRLKLDRQAITESLVGEDALQQMREVNLWVKVVREKFSQLTTIKSPPRSRGVDIEFSTPDTGPGFVLKRLAVSGVATVDKERVPYSGIVQDITSDPRQWGRPTRMNFHMQGPRPVDLVASIDRTGPTSVWKLELSGELPQPKSMQFGDSDGPGLRILAGGTSWHANLTIAGDRLAGTLRVQQKNVQISPTGTDSEPIQTVAFEFDERRMLRDALAAAVANVHEIDILVSLDGTLQHPEWDLQSSLGDDVAAGLTAHMKQQFEVQRTLLLQQLETLARNETDRLRQQLDSRFRDVAAKLNLSEDKARQLVQQYAGQTLPLGGQPVNIGGRPVSFDGKSLQIGNQPVDLGNPLKIAQPPDLKKLFR